MIGEHAGEPIDGAALPTRAWVDFCGELTAISDTGVVTIGRDGDIAVDDNPFLHRLFLEVGFWHDILWVTNIGTAITATVSNGDGSVQSWLAPGARLPLVFSPTVVWFTAGPTTYELDVHLVDPPFVARVETAPTVGETTIGRVTFTPDQRLLILALAEDVLRRGNRGAGAIPPSSQAAARLGWTITKFNRKLDNVCEKLSRLGIRGLVSTGTQAASNRRARLVEYALAARLVAPADLGLLDSCVRRDGP